MKNLPSSDTNAVFSISNLLKKQTKKYKQKPNTNVYCNTL